MKGRIPPIIHGEGLEGTQRPQVEAEREKREDKPFFEMRLFSKEKISFFYLFTK